MKKGVKYDENKLRYDLMPVESFKGIVEVLTFGAKKYSDNNWKKVLNPKNRYYAATIRHLELWRYGEKNDIESGLLHLQHAATCIIFLLWFEIKDSK